MRVKPAYPLHTVNFVCVARLDYMGAPGFQFPLQLMAEPLGGVSGARGLRSLNIHSVDPPSTCLLFSSGVLISCGNKTEEDAILTMLKLVRRIRVLFDWPIRWSKYYVRNTVCSMALGYPLDLDLFYRDYGYASEYEPALFSGLRCLVATPSPKPCVILNKSGAVVTVGTLSLQHARQVVTDMKLARYRMGATYDSMPAEHRRERPPVALTKTLAEYASPPASPSPSPSPSLLSMVALPRPQKKHV